MPYHTEIAGTYEPKLVDIFNELNDRIFDGQLPMPDAICYDYRRVGTKKRPGRGGQIYYRYIDGHCYHIVVRGKQKGNTNHETLAILHEMVHLSLVQQFFKFNLDDTNFRIQDFVNDKSGSFILECAKVATKFGITYDDLAKWNVAMNPDQDTTMTSKRYNEVQAAKALLV